MLKRNSLQKPARDMPLVLVVDDNEDNVLFACGSLDLLNFQYVVARDGQTAIDIAKDKLPDLILLDVVMPGMDGITVMQTLKCNSRTNHIPIIAVTGLAFSAQKKMILKGGCDDYLCKPYLIEELEQKLGLFLDLNSLSCLNNR